MMLIQMNCQKGLFNTSCTFVPDETQTVSLSTALIYLPTYLLRVISGLGSLVPWFHFFCQLEVQVPGSCEDLSTKIFSNVYTLSVSCTKTLGPCMVRYYTGKETHTRRRT